MNECEEIAPWWDIVMICIWLEEVVDNVEV